MLKIVTFGGGTGAPVIIQALLLAGFKNISCICASMDSGGKTGLIRSDERDQVIAISDLLRNLLALIPSDKQKKLAHRQEGISAFTEMVSFIDGRQRSLGYTIYYALLEKYQNNFLQVQLHLEKLLGVKFSGTAIPITTDSSNIFFQTQSGQTFRGEHELDKQSMSRNMITNIWLDPMVQATPEARRAIKKADYLIFCPGSLYGSVLANFLPKGIKGALKKSKAKKILISNIVSNRNQTHQFTPRKYLKVFSKYSGLKKPFDVIISPHLSQKAFDKKYPKTSKSYSLEHSHFIGWPQSTIKKFAHKHIKVLTSDIFYVTPKLHRLRHDPAKLAKIFKKIIK